MTASFPPQRLAPPVLASPSVDPVDPGLLSRALEVAGRLANDAAEVISATAERGGRGGAGDGPHPFDWITDTELTLERHTRRVLAAEFPDIPLVGGLHEDHGGGDLRGGDLRGGERRTGEPRRSRYRWMVSPVDGSANYVAGLPWYAFGLALLDDRGPVVGVLSDPSRAEIYAAARGRGMRANGVPVRLPGAACPTTRRSGPTGPTGQRSSAYPAPPGLPLCTELVGQECWPGLSTFLAHATGAGREVRVLGSAALAITQVALGHAVATVLPRCRLREVAAGLALALEAGAVVLDEWGRPTALPSAGLLVAVPSVVHDVLDWWLSARGERDGRTPAGPGA